MSSKSFDVIFVLPHMGRGGAQRVTSIVANAWARQGKRICVVTWDGQQEKAHNLDSAIVRIDMPSFMRSIMRRSGLMRQARFEVQHRLRELERWMRPLWNRRKLKKGEPVSVPRASKEERYFPDSRPWWASHHVRRGVVLLGTAIDRRKEQPVFRAIVPFQRKLLSWLVLGDRVGLFREVFSELQAPVVISLLTKTNLYVLEATRGMDVRVVVSERNDPDLQQIDPALAALRRLAYREAGAVTSNSAGILKKLSAFVPEEKLELLPNPIVAPAIAKAGRLRRDRFVTVARLVHQKGIDLLLSAFAQIADEAGGWDLEIVGDGPLRGALIRQAETLGIAGRVRFHGHVPDPLGVFQSSRVFVLPSRFEGMPNALLEAMACELAPIVTNASPGPLESVRHNETGLVVPAEDATALAAAMRQLAADQDLTDRLARRASAYVKAHDWTVVEPQWLAVLEGAGEQTEHIQSDSPAFVAGGVLR